jgi:ethanolamine utilization cobalamin adenosyltransferase
MKLQLRTQLEHDIADLLWAAMDMRQVNAIVNQYGAPARAIRDLMIAEALDQEMDCDLARQILADY